MRRAYCFAGAALCAALFAQTATRPRIFESNGDVGTVLHPGSASWDAAQDAWTVAGSGENMWFGADAFQFVWKKASGDITLTADIAFPAPGGNPHRKAVLMVRQSLDADSPYADVALHGVGLTSLQYRDARGANTHEIEANVSAPARLRIEKRGADFYMFLGGANGEPAFAGGSVRVPLAEPFYVGIGVCAHERDAVEKAVFSHVRLEETAPAAAAQTKFYSTLETVTVASTDRRVTYVTGGRIEDPSWTADGASLLFRRNGGTERIPAAGGVPVSVPGDPAPLPPDWNSGAGYSYFNSDRVDRMQVWRVRSDGTGEEPITSDALANWFPRLSPDKQRLAFLSAGREDEILLRAINLADRRIAVIATMHGGRESLVPPAWSPDSRRLAFVSYQWITAITDVQRIE